MDPEAPSRGGTAVAICPVCQASFVPAPNKQYCGKLCKDTAYRRRHQVPAVPIVVPPNQPRRPFTVYECEACGTRSVGDQRCEECGSFMRRVGLGGHCPHCLFTELETTACGASGGEVVQSGDHLHSRSVRV